MSERANRSPLPRRGGRGAGRGQRRDLHSKHAQDALTPTLSRAREREFARESPGDERAGEVVGLASSGGAVRLLAELHRKPAVVVERAQRLDEIAPRQETL